MLKHLKLTSISRLIVVFMLAVCINLSFITIFFTKNISQISSNWKLFQLELSEKSRLESRLRESIGYGGMIHDFKNYILRQESGRIKHVQSHISASLAILNQYEKLDITTAEVMALKDIKIMLNHYEKAIFKSENMFAKGKPINEVDNAVFINDARALRGLRVLRTEVRRNSEPDLPLSKARISADLRAAIGYGGMIHGFKNYILRHKSSQLKNTEQMLQKVFDAILQYRDFELSKTESMALDDIEFVMNQYAKNLSVVTRKITEGLSNKAIDRLVVVNDQPALHGLSLLDIEISHQVIVRNNSVTNALKKLENKLDINVWGSILFLVFVVITIIWLMQFHIINPILRLTRSMVKLANNDLSESVSYQYRENELGDVARAIIQFKDNIIKRNEAEVELEYANNVMSIQLESIQSLREVSAKQTTKALKLAEGMLSARENAEKAMATAEDERHRVRSILNAVRDAIITINIRGTIESINPATEVIFGYSASEMIGKNVSMLLPEGKAKNNHDDYLANFKEGNSTREINSPAEQVAMRKNGDEFHVEVVLNTMLIDDEIKVIGVVKDISKRIERDEKIKHLAMTDPLTGLANRHKFNTRLAEAVSFSQRSNLPFALMSIDLDKFKPVNDNYGHAVGDLLLQSVADMLNQCCRVTDTIARVGGDEFIIILVSTELTLDVHIPAQRIIQRLSQPHIIKEQSITIGASIGISSWTSSSTDIEELQSQADIAMYRAKKSGRNCYQIFGDNKVRMVPL